MPLNHCEFHENRLSKAILFSWS